MRPRINGSLDRFLTAFPRLKKHPHLLAKEPPLTEWPALAGRLAVAATPGPVDWLEPGHQAATKVLDRFLRERLEDYDEARNDPVRKGQSDLSPYLHFGQISAQSVALAVQRSHAPAARKEAFLEELIVRRELSDNFCFYNENYDSLQGCAPWAQKTLREHRQDVREHVYSRARLENSETHDELWNAAQTEMVRRGKMHGYMRMYWAKKILEWSQSPEEALQTAIDLNDRYELDGRDPSGYVGAMWSIGGVHDRAWTERPVFGKIRYMNRNGCRRKFDVDAYIRSVT